APTGPQEDRFVSGDLVIDFALHEVQVAGQAVPLTPKEYRMLEVLARHAGTVVPNDLLLSRVWGPDWIASAGYVKVFIRRLRKKLGDDAEQPRYIETVWGIGYRLVGRR
ncbi:MAG: winged helix-turn-helix domain-containing protein, partial [Chloroflexota bacterium]|nr:winged helix-turn-helix domain-containing protein [Chloroflexota bacterium]